jgi:hypothetical protein
LKTRTTNDNTECVIDDHTVIKRFFLFPLHWTSRGEVLPAAANANFHGIVQKTHSQCQR